MNFNAWILKKFYPLGHALYLSMRDNSDDWNDGDTSSYEKRPEYYFSPLFTINNQKIGVTLWVSTSSIFPFDHNSEAADCQLGTLERWFLWYASSRKTVGKIKARRKLQVKADRKAKSKTIAGQFKEVHK